MKFSTRILGLLCICLFVAGCVLCFQSQQLQTIKQVNSSSAFEYLYQHDNKSAEVTDEKLERHKREIWKPRSWTNWTSWSPCSDSCNAAFGTKNFGLYGTRIRTRVCLDIDGERSECRGNFREIERCNDFPCPEEEKEVEVSKYELAVQRRKQLRDSGKTLHSATEEDLKMKPLDAKRKYGKNHFGSKTGLYGNIKSGSKGGRWTAWMSWGKCSKSCLGGVRERYRTCLTPDMQPSFSCYGEFIEKRECDYITCEEAKKKAEEEEIERNPMPSMNHEVSQELLDRIANGEEIEVNWEKWGSWGSCSRSCVNGTRTRYRMCRTPEGHVYPGCEGESMESGICNLISCEEANQNKYSGLFWDPEDNTIKMRKPVNSGIPSKKSSSPYNDEDAPGVAPVYKKNRPYSSGGSPKRPPKVGPPRKSSSPYSDGDAPVVTPVYKKNRPYSAGGSPKRPPKVGPPRKSSSPYSDGDAPVVAPVYKKNRPYSDGSSPKRPPKGGPPRKSSSPYSDGDAPVVAPVYNKNSPYSAGDSPKRPPKVGPPKKSSSPYSDEDAPVVAPVYNKNSPYSAGDSPKLPPIVGPPRKSSGPYSDRADAPNVPPIYQTNSDTDDSPVISDFRVTGEWGEWMRWQQCSATCGKGQRVRDRKCDSPPPADGGEPCFGNNIETETCAAETLCADGTMIHEMTVTIDLDARLSCDAEWYLVHHPDATVAWYKDQENVILKNDIKEVGLGDLQIKKVNQQNEGVYACAITKNEQTYYNNVVLLKIKRTMTLMEMATTQPQRLVIPILLPFIILVLAVVTLHREHQRMKSPSDKQKKEKTKKETKKKGKAVSESSDDDGDGDGGFGGPPPPPPGGGAGPIGSPEPLGPSMPGLPPPGPPMPGMPPTPRPPIALPGLPPPGLPPPGPNMPTAPQMPRPPMPGGPPPPPAFGGPTVEGERPRMALNLLDSIRNQ